MKAVWEWIKAAWAWVKKHWKLVLGVLAGIFGAIAIFRGGTAIAGMIRKAKIGKVTFPNRWKPVPGTMNLIEVRTSAGKQTFELPDGVTSNLVRRVSVSDQNDVTVEVDNEVIDRR
jgi:hypothetical protein